jgi:hypothetical protein
MNLIILEGPDGSGKTTLAKALEKAGYTYYHFGVPPPGADLFRFFMEPLLAATRPTVFDRCYPSNAIYEPVMRPGGAVLTDIQEALLTRVVAARGGQVVLCLPPWRTVLANWLKKKGEEYVQDVEKMENIYVLYRNLAMVRYEYPVFDYTRTVVGSYVAALSLQCNCVLPAGMVGSPNARFLLVGERPNPNSLTPLPFLDYRNSSGYLTECLWDAGYTEPELAFANAFNANDQQTSFNDEEKRWTIIALGEVASASLHQQGVKHYPLPHPQFWKRFYAGERDKYVEKLAKIRREAP